MNILQWISDNFNKLWTLVVSWYDRLVQLASYGLDWIYNQIVSLANWALTEADKFTSQVSAWAQSWFNWISTQLTSLANGIQKAVTDAASYAWKIVNDLRNSLQAALTDAFNWLIGWVNGVAGALQTDIQNALQWVGQLWSGLQSTLDAFQRQVVAWFNTTVGVVASQLAASVNNVLQTVNAFRQTWEDRLVSFFDHPGAFIFAYIEAYVYKWAEWFLAGLLGAVAVALPAKPDLFGQAAGSQGTGGPNSLLPPGGFVWPANSHSLADNPYTKDHPGIDIVAPDGTAALASAAGLVARVSWSNAGYGNYVDLLHPSGWLTRYAHLRQALVQVGQYVEAGFPVGLIGNTGNSHGSHLHFETLQNGVPVDPMKVVNIPEGTVNGG